MAILEGLEIKEGDEIRELHGGGIGNSPETLERRLGYIANFQLSGGKGGSSVWIRRGREFTELSDLYVELREKEDIPLGSY